MSFSELDDTAVGGYFGLHESLQPNWITTQKNLFQSARAAFVAFAREKAIKRIWLPRFLCHSIEKVCLSENIKISYYGLSSKFDLEGINNPTEDDWYYFVNYFGTSKKLIDRWVASYPKEKIILDFCQALFSQKDYDVAAIIFSPRKFLGVADGGVVFTKTDLTRSYMEDKSTAKRLAFLIKRTEGNLQKGYQEYLRSERLFENYEPKLMSKTTKAMINGINLIEVEAQRNLNYNYYNQHLESINAFTLKFSPENSPLCYPYLSKNKDLKRILIENRVFIPTYWPELLNIDRSGIPVEIENLLPLPIDQRYTQVQLEKVIKIICENEK